MAKPAASTAAPVAAKTAAEAPTATRQVIDTSQGAGNDNTAAANGGKLIYLNGEQKATEEQPAATNEDGEDPLKAKMGELSQ